MKVHSCQLLVAGGGVAGCCAAIAAARSGVKTILVEQQGYLGGSGYAGMFQHICGLYLNGNLSPEETLNGGLTGEIVELLQGKSPHTAVQKIGQVYVLPYLAADLHDILTALLGNEPNVTLLRNSTVTAVETEDGVIRRTTLETAAGMATIAAKMVVDCTGNGDVAALAGADFEFSPDNERQLAGFSIRVSGLTGYDDALPVKVPFICSRAVTQGILPPLVEYTTFRYGANHGEGYIKLSIDGEASLERDASAARNAHALIAYLAELLPTFKSAAIVAMSPQALDREGRRIVGDYMLTGEDVLTARKFPDAVAKNAWPIELWDRTKGTLYQYPPQGDYYEIPFGCIVVKGVANLLTAGRCISVTHAALGSTRVMGACMALGEAAGLAAAYYVTSGRYPATHTRQV